MEWCHYYVQNYVEQILEEDVKRKWWKRVLDHFVLCFFVIWLSILFLYYFFIEVLKLLCYAPAACFYSIQPYFVSHWRVHRSNRILYQHAEVKNGCFFDELDPVYNKQVRLYCYTHRIVMPIAPGVYFYDSSVGEKLIAVHHNVPVMKGYEQFFKDRALQDLQFLDDNCLMTHRKESGKVTADKIKLKKEDCKVTYRMLVCRIEKPVEPIYRALVSVDATLGTYKMSCSHLFFDFGIRCEGTTYYSSKFRDVFPWCQVKRN